MWQGVVCFLVRSKISDWKPTQQAYSRGDLGACLLTCNTGIILHITAKLIFIIMPLRGTQHKYSFQQLLLIMRGNLNISLSKGKLIQVMWVNSVIWQGFKLICNLACFSKNILLLLTFRKLWVFLDTKNYVNLPILKTIVKIKNLPYITTL